METVQYAEQLHQALSVLFPLCSSEVREALILGFDFINRSHSSQLACAGWKRAPTEKWKSFRASCMSLSEQY